MSPMRTIPILAAAVFALTACAPLNAGLPEPARADYTKIAYWNAEHFVDDIDDPYVEGSNEDTGGRSKKTLALYAKAIKALDADVLILAETEGEAWVRRFNKEFLDGMNYDTVTCARDENWHQNIVVVSRIPVGALTTLKAKKIPIEGREPTALFNNRLMTIEIMPNENYRLVLSPTHLKAGITPEDKATRIAMGNAAKELFRRELTLDPNANILFIGDMNFSPGGDEYNALLSGGPKLVDLQAANKNPGTHPAEYPTRHIDMSFANENLLGEVVPGSVAVARPLPRAEQAETSDHLPIVVSIYPKDR